MRHVTFRQLQIFTAVLEGGSFAAAARQLHLTPPAVTLQMQQLETHAGMPILERIDGALRATAAGRELVGLVARIAAAMTECSDSLAALRGLSAGRVAIGVVSTAKYFAPQALAAFARLHPAIDIRLDVGNRADIISALESSELDLALTGWPPEQLAAEKAPIGEHPHVIIARPDHRFAHRHRCKLEALAGEAFVGREAGSGTRLLMERLFADAGIAPRICMEMGSNETIKQAVIAGLGIAFLSAHTVAAELADGRLVMLDVVGLPVIRTWFVVHLKKKRLLPAAAALREFLIAEGQRILPPVSTGAVAMPQRAARAGRPSPRRTRSIRRGTQNP